MITSLLKVGLLSLISCITPLKAVSSNQDHTADNEVIFKSDNKKYADVGNVGYYPYVFKSFDNISNALGTGFAYRAIQYTGDFRIGRANNTFKTYSSIVILKYRMSGDNYSLTVTLAGNGNDTVTIYESNVTPEKLRLCFYLRGGITDIQLVDSDETDYVDKYLKAFNDDLYSEYVDFQFSDQINYNALFNTTISSSYFASSNQYNDSILDSIIFSNGRFYEGLYCSTQYADGKTFLVDGGDSIYNYGYYTVPTSYEGAYSYVDKIKFVGGYVVDSSHYESEYIDVNLRNTNYYDDNGTPSEFIDNSSSWVNSEFRTLRIYNISSTNFERLKSFNSNDFVMNYEYITSNGVAFYGGQDLVNPNEPSGYWLKDSFSLINTAITGIFGFLNINILPGLTVGSLVLIPFAVSMLFLAITFFKR